MVVPLVKFVCFTLAPTPAFYLVHISKVVDLLSSSAYMAEFALLSKVATSHQYEVSHMSALMEPKVHPPIDSVPLTSGVVPRCTSWLVAGTLLMGLNTYLP
ncbi:hypothetical protein DSO57_1038971 [Entomophthora muscae]|uniref:Uncharacterized protein n=1 Tax=Entomophthora muscae TaxID=34485 RepID=A0ACC2U9A6_9FUNG|nr:hypothetical protein DSO57_1038971 [Entomophthora muscae]